jgi:hypothetical protein
VNFADGESIRLVRQLTFSVRNIFSSAFLTRKVVF